MGLLSLGRAVGGATQQVSNGILVISRSEANGIFEIESKNMHRLGRRFELLCDQPAQRGDVS